MCNPTMALTDALNQLITSSEPFSIVVSNIFKNEDYWKYSINVDYY